MWVQSQNARRSQQLMGRRLPLPNQKPRRSQPRNSNPSLSNNSYSQDTNDEPTAISVGIADVPALPSVDIDDDAPDSMKLLL